MALKKRTETVALSVIKKQNILLTITIGNAQIGGNVVRFKNASGILGKGEIQNLDLGLGSDLIGKTLKVTTNILDVNDQTNGVVVTYFFHNCDPAATMFHDTVKDDGDIFSFIVEFNFN
jgi:hypothetical protein